MLSYYKKLIALRKNPKFLETFTYGAFVPAYEKVPGIFAYKRVSEKDGKNILVIGNYGDCSCVLPLGGVVKQILLSNVNRNDMALEEMNTQRSITLDSCESIVLLMQKQAELILLKSVNRAL
ncbi:MAG: hypothetical protein ACLTAX_16180 [Waltera sp.]